MHCVDLGESFPTSIYSRERALKSSEVRALGTLSINFEIFETLICSPEDARLGPADRLLDHAGGRADVRRPVEGRAPEDARQRGPLGGSVLAEIAAPIGEYGSSEELLNVRNRLESRL